MSTDALRETTDPGATPELTPLGKRLEILRIERGISKQLLARQVGTSRQQLWRVMTGKSKLTSSLRGRLATALSVDSAHLSNATHRTHGQIFASGAASMATGSVAGPPTGVSAPNIIDYLSEPWHVAVTLRSLPTGDPGRRLKRALLNTLEDLAVEASHALPAEYSEIRRRVLAGEL